MGASYFVIIRLSELDKLCSWREKHGRIIEQKCVIVFNRLLQVVILVDTCYYFGLKVLISCHGPVSPMFGILWGHGTACLLGTSIHAFVSSSIRVVALLGSV